MAKFFSTPVMVIVAAATVAGCDSNGEQAPLAGAPVTTIETPEFIRQVANVDPSALALHVTINGEVQIFRGQGDQPSWEVTVNAPSGVNSDVLVGWFQTVDGESLRLAEQGTSVFVGEAPQRLELTSSYTTSGEGFDADGDGFTNLQELQSRRNPLSDIDLEIPRSSASFVQPSLPIDTPVEVDNSGNDDNTRSKFSVWHDGTQLRLFVCVADDMVVSDSENEYFHDDNIEIYIDSDNSKGEFYDSVNDYQLTFDPGRGMVFPNSSNLPIPTSLGWNFAFENSSCGYELSVQIDIAELGLTVGSAFGLDVEVIDDDNGGLRDAKYAWIGFENVDDSAVRPASFGTVRLAP